MRLYELTGIDPVSLIISPEPLGRGGLGGLVGSRRWRKDEAGGGGGGRKGRREEKLL